MPSTQLRVSVTALLREDRASKRLRSQRRQMRPRRRRTKRTRRATSFIRTGQLVIASLSRVPPTRIRRSPRNAIVVLVLVVVRRRLGRICRRCDRSGGRCARGADERRGRGERLGHRFPQPSSAHSHSPISAKRYRRPRPRRRRRPLRSSFVGASGASAAAAIAAAADAPEAPTNEEDAESLRTLPLIRTGQLVIASLSRVPPTRIRRSPRNAIEASTRARGDESPASDDASLDDAAEA
jgi:hypothetical protein